MSRYNNWYKSRRWRRRRRMQLAEHPLCEMCLRDKRIVAAEVVDHVEPHRGDKTKFWIGAVSSLCKQHHNRTKQQIETRGFSQAIGDDGWPTDPNHPVYRGRFS